MFEHLDALPADSLLGLIAAYRQDPNPSKVDLGVGVYKDESGHTAIMKAIQKAAQQHAETEDSKTYIGPGGVPGFADAIKQLLLGEQSVSIADKRLAALQTPGGCGALRVAAELLVLLKDKPTVWVSDPTWANHMPLIESAGLKIKTYPYFDAATGVVNYQAMDEKLAQLGPTDVVLLHGCCHNPTGADLSFENWQTITERALKQGFIPFVDLAYQGRYLSERVEEMLIATSCSKNFGLYRERVGCLLVQTKNATQAQAIQTQIQSIARGIYSMPPAYGGFLVNIILNDQKLKTEWTEELANMATRIKSLRSGLLEQIQAHNIQQDFSFITQQKGMFTYLGITPEQVVELREKYSIYMANSSRINVAGLNNQCLGYVAESLKAVI